jgi:hypothetical protein
MRSMVQIFIIKWAAKKAIAAQESGSDRPYEE